MSEAKPEEAWVIVTPGGSVFAGGSDEEEACWLAFCRDRYEGDCVLEEYRLYKKGLLSGGWRVLEYRPAPAWVSVGDGLPGEEDEYLAWDVDRLKRRVLHFDGSLFRDRWGEYVEVSHWQQLPQPPTTPAASP